MRNFLPNILGLVQNPVLKKGNDLVDWLSVVSPRHQSKPDVCRWLTASIFNSPMAQKWHFRVVCWLNSIVCPVKALPAGQSVWFRIMSGHGSIHRTNITLETVIVLIMQKTFSHMAKVQFKPLSDVLSQTAVLCRTLMWSCIPSQTERESWWCNL